MAPRRSYSQSYFSIVTRRAGTDENAQVDRHVCRYNPSQPARVGEIRCTRRLPHRVCRGCDVGWRLVAELARLRRSLRASAFLTDFYLVHDAKR